MSEAIPPTATHEGRTIVLCFDGTQNKISDKLSNVALLFSLLDRTDPSKQLVYYQTGIGTYTSSALTKGPISSRVAKPKTLDSMVATSLDDHVKEGYRYLMDNYSPGDKICVFGFSRGAHTARALVAMLYKVGLLQRGNHQHIEYAWAAFILRTEEGWARAATFKRMFGMSVPIEFVGVWDSVGSVGIDGLAIQFGLNNTTVKTFRHALALDERRCRFKVNAWEAYNYKQAPSFLQFEDQNYKSSGLDTPTDVLEVWFAGAHSDVGGGNSTITEEHALSRIPLRWMVRECFKTKSGIRFSITALRDIGMDPDALYPEVKKRPPLIFTESLSETDKTRLMERLPVKASQQETYTDVDEDPFADHTQLTEEEEDLLDSMCGVRDELQHRKIWWLLEILPLRQFLQQSSGDWEFSWTINLGRPRFIPSQTKRTVNVHRSVRQKMENEDWLEGMERYQPKASLAVALETENVLWVD